MGILDDYFGSMFELFGLKRVTPKEAMVTAVSLALSDRPKKPLVDLMALISKHRAKLKIQARNIDIFKSEKWLANTTPPALYKRLDEIEKSIDKLVLDVIKLLQEEKFGNLQSLVIKYKRALLQLLSTLKTTILMLGELTPDSTSLTEKAHIISNDLRNAESALQEISTALEGSTSESSARLAA